MVLYDTEPNLFRVQVALEVTKFRERIAKYVAFFRRGAKLCIRMYEYVLAGTVVSTFALRFELRCTVLTHDFAGAFVRAKIITCCVTRLHDMMPHAMKPTDTHGDCMVESFLMLLLAHGSWSRSACNTSCFLFQAMLVIDLCVVDELMIVASMGHCRAPLAHHDLARVS